MRSNKVQDITELDEDMHFRLPSNEDRDIDLSLLTAVLCSSEQVRAERRGGVHVSDIQRPCLELEGVVVFRSAPLIRAGVSRKPEL